MLTLKEKKFLLDLLNNVTVSGNRKTIPQTLEELDRLAKKIEMMPTEESVEPQRTAAKKK